MKSKTLITIAVASTIGWSAAAFAGSSHEVLTPYSPNESGDVNLSQERLFGVRSQTSDIGGISDQAGGAVSGSYGDSGFPSSSLSDSSSFSGSSGETASLSMEESLAAADQGSYSDFYVVMWSPMAVESWDYYIIDDGESAHLVGIGETLIPTHELALVPSASDEMIYELTLVPVSSGDMTAAFPSGTSEEAAG